MPNPDKYLPLLPMEPEDDEEETDDDDVEFHVPSMAKAMLEVLAGDTSTPNELWWVYQEKKADQ